MKSRKTALGAFLQKVCGKTVQSDFLREREGNIHRHRQLYRSETCNGTTGQQRTNRTANVYVQVATDHHRQGPHLPQYITPPPPPPAVVRMPACHSRRFKGERPIGAAEG